MFFFCNVSFNGKTHKRSIEKIINREKKGGGKACREGEWKRNSKPGRPENKNEREKQRNETFFTEATLLIEWMTEW